MSIKDIVQNTTNASAALAEEGKKIVFKPNSELNRVYSVVETSIENFLAGDSTTEEYIDHLAAMLDAKNNQLLDSEMDSLVHNMALGFANKIGYIKNTVIPVLETYKESVETQRNKFKAVNEASLMEMEYIEMPVLLQVPAMLNYLARYTADNRITITASITIGNITANELKSSLTDFGNTELDNAISKWLDTLGDDYIMDVWNRYFKVVSPSNIAYSNLRSVNILDDVNERLLVFLIAVAFNSNPPDIIVDKDKFAQALAEIRDMAGVYLVIYINVYNRYANTLVIRYDKEDKKVYVNVEVMKAFIEKEGTPEVIYGKLISSNKTFLTMDEVVEDMESAKKTWDQYYALKESQFMAAEKRMARQILIAAFTDTLSVMDDTEKEILEELNTNKEQLINKCTKYVNAMRDVNFNELDETCRDVICNCRYWYTDAKMFLEFMEDEYENNKDIDAKVAALLATVRYISVYLAGQTSLVNAQ